MNILFFTSRFPYPPIKGDKIRAYYPIKHLASKHYIDLISFSEADVDTTYLKEMEKYCRKVSVVRLNKVYYLFLLALGIFSPVPSQTLCYTSSRMKRLIRHEVQTRDYDIVHIVCGRLAGYAKHIGNSLSVIDWIDALSMSTERMYVAERSWIKKVLYFLEWKKMKAFEMRHVSGYDYSFITSQADRDYLDGEIDEVIPNGVDATTFHARDVPKNIDLVFTGNMGYFPNRKAVEFFTTEVFPVILQKRPATTFYIVGISPGKKIMSLHDGTHIFVTGFVESMTDILNRSSIYVAPLRSGAGIQNKILEALACALPVVSTSYGNSGIKARDGEEIVVRDDPEGFARAVLALLGNKEKREMLGRNGLELVKKHFRWESTADRLNEIYSDLSTGRRLSKQEH